MPQKRLLFFEFLVFWVAPFWVVQCAPPNKAYKMDGSVELSAKRGNGLNLRSVPEMNDRFITYVFVSLYIV